MSFGMLVANSSGETVIDDISPTMQYGNAVTIDNSVSGVDVIYYADKYQFNGTGLSNYQAPLAIPGTSAPYVDETNVSYALSVFEVAIGSTIWMFNNDTGGAYSNDTRHKAGGFAYDFNTINGHILYAADFITESETHGMHIYDSDGRVTWRASKATARILTGGTIPASTIGTGLGWSITVNSTANCVWCNGGPLYLGLDSDPNSYSGNQIRMTYASRLSSTQWKFGRGHIADAVLSSNDSNVFFRMPMSYVLAQVD